MQKSDNDIQNEQELHHYLLENLGLLDAAYASDYPGCEPFCEKAIASILESLHRLNRLPRTNPFWANTNNRPTIYKLFEYNSQILKENAQDTLALWTKAALDVSGGIDEFGSQYWKALHLICNLDVKWPIFAALLQGGKAGISASALATLLLDTNAVEEALPHLQRHAESTHPHISAWAVNVLELLKADFGGGST